MVAGASEPLLTLLLDHSLHAAWIRRRVNKGPRGCEWSHWSATEGWLCIFELFRVFLLSFWFLSKKKSQSSQPISCNQLLGLCSPPHSLFSFFLLPCTQRGCPVGGCCCKAWNIWKAYRGIHAARFRGLKHLALSGGSAGSLYHPIYHFRTAITTPTRITFAPSMSSRFAWSLLLALILGASSSRALQFDVKSLSVLCM
jgi:hypothetical protein